MRERCALALSAQICAWRGRFAKFLKFAKLDVKLLEHNFSVLPKIDGCQVDLVNSWRCWGRKKRELGKSKGLQVRVGGREPLALRPLNSIYIDNGLQVAPWWGWI
jgi:hypothetical protein